jgi:hypothetical protein
MAGRFLLLVTETGHAKRLAVADIPLTKRGREGVRVSFEALAAAVVVTIADEVVIATRGGMIERVAAADVPVMGRRARGARVITLGPGDGVARVAIVPQTPLELHPGGVCGPRIGELDVGTLGRAQRWRGRARRSPRGRVMATTGIDARHGRSCRSRGGAGVMT